MLHKRLMEVENQVVAHSKYHSDFTRALPKPEYAEEWTAVVEEWDQDWSKPSPYLSVAERRLYIFVLDLILTVSYQDVMEQDLKAKLKEDERYAKACGEISIYKISATACLGLGLLIEDSQYVIHSVQQSLRY